MRTAIAFFAAALLAACSASPAGSRNGGDAVMPAGDSASADCPITASADWAAWINAMPGPGRSPNLIVTGKVTVPTGGYRFSFDDPIVAESDPIQVTVTIVTTAPSGGATQAVTTESVRGSWPMNGPVGSVTVKCGSKLLAHIAPVETVH